MGRTIEAVTRCPICKKVAGVNVKIEQLERIAAGEHVQNVCPELSDDDRERLITGICPKCWEDIFCEEDE